MPKVDGNRRPNLNPMLAQLRIRTFWTVPAVVATPLWFCTSTAQRLSGAVLEAGSNWITAWLDRLDHKSEVMRAFSNMKLLPSEYFKRQCLIAAEPGESITGHIVEHLGDDYVVWASDYPHLDASFNVVRDIREKIAGLPEVSQRKVLGENAARFYGLSG